FNCYFSITSSYEQPPSPQNPPVVGSRLGPPVGIFAGVHVGIGVLGPETGVFVPTTSLGLITLGNRVICTVCPPDPPTFGAGDDIGAAMEPGVFTLAGCTSGDIWPPNTSIAPMSQTAPFCPSPSMGRMVRISS